MSTRLQLRFIRCARERPTVSTPVSWDEVEKTLKKKDAGLLVFEAKQAVARMEKLGDLFAPVLELKQRLPDLKKMAAPAAEKIEEPISIAAQADDEKPLRKRPRAARKAAVRSRARKTNRRA